MPPHAKTGYSYRSDITTDVRNMLSAAQLRAARALLGLDQRRLAEAAGLSLPTIQRMEASDGQVRTAVSASCRIASWSRLAPKL